MNKTIKREREIVERDRPESLWRQAMGRFSEHKAAIASLVILLTILCFAIVGPWISPYTLTDIDYANVMSGISAKHFFGTDALGRDLLLRLMYGVRLSLLVGFVGTIVSFVIGTIYGMVAGYMQGRTDMIMMRLVDILYALPFMFFVIILVVYFGRSIVFIFIAIGAIQWLTMARIVRGETLRLKNLDFVRASHVMGASVPRILLRHIFPNLIGIVVTYITLTVPQVIIVESFLSFLGLGVQEPLASLGSLLSDGAQNMQVAPWTLIFPAVFLAVILACFNYVGDGLRDAFDPKNY